MVFNINKRSPFLSRVRPGLCTKAAASWTLTSCLTTFPLQTSLFEQTKLTLPPKNCSSVNGRSKQWEIPVRSFVRFQINNIMRVVYYYGVWCSAPSCVPFNVGWSKESKKCGWRKSERGHPVPIQRKLVVASFSSLFSSPKHPTWNKKVPFLYCCFVKEGTLTISTICSDLLLHATELVTCSNASY